MPTTSRLPKQPLVRVLGAALLALVVAGCGSSEQKYATIPTGVSTPAENIRQSLEQLEKSGKFDSGTSLIKGEIEKLRADSSVNVDELLKDFDKLMASKSPSQIRSHAKALAAKLPAKA